MKSDLLEWLLQSDEPWTQYRTRIDILEQPPDHPEVQVARREMLSHPLVESMIVEINNWPGYALKRHNDSKHPIYKLSTLADFGLHMDDPGISSALQNILDHQSEQGAFQTLENFPKAFGGSGEDIWGWVLCDAPTLLYSILALGAGDDSKVKPAVDHLITLSEENGWRCSAAPELGGFRSPGKKLDPCPIANVYILKALSSIPELNKCPETIRGTEMLLNHWYLQDVRKIYLFGIGTDFRKIKYPYVWYDILHVVEVLSRFSFVHKDERYLEMISTLTSQADHRGRYTARAMYMPWKEWSFADKKNPSPWLTFLVLRILKRSAALNN